MKVVKRLAVTALATMIAPAFAAPPAAINVHGQLIGPGGDSLSGARTYQVTFYDAATGGNVLGTAVTGMVTVADNGLFNMAVTPPAAILTAGEVWYALGVDTDVPADNDASDDVFPNRIRVYSVPFALQAQEVVGVAADRVGDGMVDNTEFNALDGVTSNIQQQLDAVDGMEVTQNTADIATNTSNIATNTSNIATNTSNIATNTTNIAANTSAIAGKADMSTVATNTTNITANSTAIAGKADASDVTTNTTNIAANATAIATKANSADVYTQTAANNAFVDVAGDTMTGALGLTQIMAPADTTDKLYNVGGSLFFGGVQLGASSLDKDAINDAGTLGFDWLDSEVADALTIAGGSVNNDSFSAYGDLTAESKIGTGSTQVAAGDHDHMLQSLGGAVTDAQVPDTITINGGTVNNNSFSAVSDLTAESAIGTGAGQVAAGNHDHMLQNLSGTATDSQIANALTIVGGSVNNDSFSALSDLMAETAIGTGSGQVAAGDHGHALSALSGSVTDAQVPDNITINGVDAADDTVGAPAITYANDPNTGIHRPGADQLAMVTNGAARLTVDNSEVNIAGNILEIASGSAPGTTTNKLYNTSGNLFWNGTQLNGGGGGSSSEFRKNSFNLSNYGTVDYPFANSYNRTVNIRHNQATGAYSAPWPLERQTYEIQAIRVLLHLDESFPGAHRIGIQYTIRDLFSGTVNHTVTSVIDLTTLTQDAWISLSITGTAADRTVEPSEFLTMYTSTISGSDGGSGEYEMAQEIEVIVQ